MIPIPIIFLFVIFSLKNHAPKKATHTYWRLARGYKILSGSRFNKETYPVLETAYNAAARINCQSLMSFRGCREKCSDDFLKKKAPKAPNKVMNAIAGMSRYHIITHRPLK